jgi:hypothetical protein
VEAGQAAPEEVMSRWVAGSGYAVCVDFLGEKQINAGATNGKQPPATAIMVRRINSDCALVCRRADQRELERVPGIFAANPNDEWRNAWSVWQRVRYTGGGA